MEKETWLFIDSGVNTPAYNMAMDEALLDWHSKGLIPPVLRFYGWNPPGLSVGYFQKTNGKIDVDRARERGYELVRRQTGGRAVLHDDELTYSVIVDEDHPNMPKTVTEAYRVISQGLLEGFRNLGLKAEFSIPEGKIGKTNSAVCFDESSWYELIIEDRKAAGSAQTRQKGVILQHGSVPMHIDDQALFDCFIYPNARVKERAMRGFHEKAAAMDEVLKRPITIDKVKEAFFEGFQKGLDVHFEPYTFTEEELKTIETIAKEKYLSDAWNFSR